MSTKTFSGPIDAATFSGGNGDSNSAQLKGSFYMGKENKRLLRLIKKHKLTSAEVAELCRVARGTVEKWRQAETAVNGRNMPPGYLELLEIKLGERTWRGYKKQN